MYKKKESIASIANDEIIIMNLRVFLDLRLLQIKLIKVTVENEDELNK